MLQHYFENLQQYFRGGSLPGYVTINIKCLPHKTGFKFNNCGVWYIIAYTPQNL
jgi:hypothetical protein